jgi:adenine-specific DNA-methyltransferase
MADIPKLDLQSKDIAADKQAKLKALFPEIFTEGDKIDFDKLRLTLGDSVDANDERFGLHWAGKKECFSIIQEPSIGTLKPAKDESVNWDDTENLFIEGDNLEVLKLLQKSYYGKVKMIYIDPPYNTGKEFIYLDKYQENIDTYLAYTGQIDDDGYKFSTNTELEGRYHSNWLNMMYPRLFLARNLLREDGVIFISIDDHEVDNLKKLGSEVFGEENFEGIIHWRRRHNQPNDKTKMIGLVAEHILAFSKNKVFLKEQGVGKIDLSGSFSNPDNDSRGAWASKPWKVGSGQSGSRYKIETPTGKIFDEEWMGEEATFKALKDDNRIIFTKNGNGFPRKKYFKFEREEEGQCASNWWSHKQFGHNQGGSKEIETLFGEKNIFDNPKPKELIRGLIQISNAQSNDIILDFFAGSATTAQSLIEFNREFSETLRFIMVQLPEKLNQNKKEQKAGYEFCSKHNLDANISELSKERIRRVIENIRNERQLFLTELQSKETALAELEAQKRKTPELFKNGKSKELTDLENSIETLKAQIANIESTDLGFKVFKLDKSNFKVWDGSVENDVPKQIQMAINHLEPDSKEFDILFEILLKAGFELTLPIKELTLVDKKVYSVEDDALLICLENELNEDVIRAIAAKEPARFVCLDAGFKDNDQLKTNAVQIMKSHNVHDFKTV